MKICFIHRGGEVMASYRFRASIPAEGLRKLGHEVCINNGEADVAIFSKPMADDCDIAKSAKAQGAKIIVDIVDDHLLHPILGPLYNDMIKVADTLVCPTREMAERVYRVSGRSAIIVPDPYEEEEQAPHAQGDQLLWFGHLMNVKDLLPWKQTLNGIRICTGPKPQPPREKEGKKLSSAGQQWNDSYIEWSRETQTQELANANIVIIPTRRGAEYKTPNRMLNAIRGGCFVVSGGHPSHEEFRKMMWMGDIKAGLDWAKAFRYELNDCVKEAQDYIRVKYSGDAVAKQWEAAL